MSVIPGLPNEVAEQVVQIMTTSDIANFSKASKAHHEVYGTDALYRDIRIYDREGSRGKLGELIQLFTQDESLARKVRRLELELDAYRENRWNGEKIKVPGLLNRLKKYENVSGVKMETLVSAAEGGHIEAQALVLLLLVERKLQWFSLETWRPIRDQAEYVVWEGGKRGDGWAPELEVDTDMSILPQLRRLRFHGWRPNIITQIGSDIDSGQHDNVPSGSMETNFPWLRLADKDFHLMNDKLQVDMEIDRRNYPANFDWAIRTFRDIRTLRFRDRHSGTSGWIELERIEDLLSRPETCLEELHICEEFVLDKEKERPVNWSTFESLKVLTMTYNALFNYRIPSYLLVFTNLPSSLEVLRIFHEEWTVTSRSPLVPKGSYQTLSYLEVLLGLFDTDNPDENPLKELKMVEIWLTLKGLDDWSDLQTSVPPFLKFTKEFERKGLRLRWIVQNPSHSGLMPEVSSI